MKKYYPVMLDIKDRKATVIGGGQVAERKVISLVDHGAIVTVVSPDTTQRLENMAEEGTIQLVKRRYKAGDLKGNFLVYVATNDQQVSGACHQEAKEENIMINVVDVPHLCDFIVPAIHRQGSLTLTVSTDGKSPMFSRKIREELQEAYGPQYQMIIDTMGEIRKKALKEISNEEERKKLFHKLTYHSKVKDIEDYKEQQEEMWEIYQGFRNREGCDNSENNKNWI